ncbi:MAG: biotin/lipoyl-binding protein, partial [Lentisphaeria bacterium]|nr:biotin/lipoyl-binding protein [Lentisphaeria bacterium]
MRKNLKRNASLRTKMKIFIWLGALTLLMILAMGISLFVFEIEDTIYCQGSIVPDKTFEIVGHLDAHVLKFNNRMGDDVKKGDIIAELDSRSYQADAITLESSIAELEAELA